MAKRKEKIPSNWRWKDKILTQEDAEEWYGFVYLIEDLENKKKYVGEKSFWTFTVPKGKVNKKKIPSDWQYYESSNKLLKSLIMESNTEKHSKFKFTILALCKDMSVMKLCEAKWILSLGALMSDKWYNDNVRITVMNTYIDYNERVTELTLSEGFAIGS